ncbi:hypothetical protein A3A55_04670 [Candidatus Roizmanbacteria bacterium RIFCSPLOWO2_01_FULL_40_14]|uniref:Glycosyl transferase group 1 n=3 Tax=Candidatus Roizmaniibacteriota TaxID=1752723 RepID=A0A0G0X1N3_9BACT|nr:MAG: Glycosyl transferase group 1 [Candidatus Roizmanbacteria bacterium GW2011_GWB1_40_7]KKR94221.1 MAG: Glycosyl transferase group 1 [Candidatus Roizmanbacteria bacterium GW2011_GWA1_41_13]KKS18964.1 MAG: Glycosyl transferase group 1 [Candidatus Roizmanbacteria bacterium GW2011_GWC2_41_7]OGK48486.1 MAG: hypothetical protein A3A55_04670 [Candidatus Roizmanbacteria bacterium RIFCSPLOWO2_01_FULL_40_14]
MRNRKSVIYVNYSPYENSGKILDYLLENFDYVFLFSLGFYNLKNKKRYNTLFIYKKKKLLKKHLLFQFTISSSLMFYLLPVRSAINLMQIMWHTFRFTKRYGKADTYFSVNAYTAWIGLIMKKMGLVQKTVFWVWDYYPPIHEDKIIMLMRMIYWQFDKISSHSDRVVFVNNRLMQLRKEIGVLPRNKSFPVVSIGTDLLFKERSDSKTLTFGFIGVIKKSQGIEMILDNAEYIKKHFPQVKFEIIGSGPDEDHFKRMVKDFVFPVTFHGYLEGESFNDVLAKCTIGIATYIPDKSNVSHYGDPGKIKRYLSLGLPVIATDVFEFSDEIIKSGAGIIIDYNDQKMFVSSVKKIMNNYQVYRRNAITLCRRYYYKKIYPKLFSAG